MYKDCSCGRYVEMINSHLLSNHFQNTIFQWSSSKLIFYCNQMIFSTFNIHNVILILSLFIALLGGISCKFKNFLLCNCDSISMVQAAKLNVLVCVIVIIYLIKNLPSDIKFHSLSYDF